MKCLLESVESDASGTGRPAGRRHVPSQGRLQKFDITRTQMSILWCLDMFATECIYTLTYMYYHTKTYTCIHVHIKIEYVSTIYIYIYIREYVPRYYVGLDTFRYIGRAALYIMLECIGMYMPNLQTCTFWCHWPMKSRYALHGFSFTCQSWKIPLFHIHASCRCPWWRLWRFAWMSNDTADPCFLPLKVKLHADPQIPPLPLAYEDKSAGKRAHKGFLIPFPCAFLRIALHTMANIKKLHVRRFVFSTSVTSTRMQHTLAKLRACGLTFIRNLLQFPSCRIPSSSLRLRLC